MYANPAANIQAIPAVILKGKKGIILLQAGNAGNDSIEKESLDVTISTALGTHIVGFARHKKSASKDWKITSRTKGTANTVHLTNMRKFDLFDLSQVHLEVEGKVLQPFPSTITCNITYKLGINKYTGEPNSAQGDATPNDNNTTSSLMVI